MQNILKKLFLTVMAIYVALSIINPEKVYVDRFLLNMSYLEWIPYQVFPSMYSTEIFIKKEDNSIVSTVHHPMRIFFETTTKKKICDTITITVNYNSISKEKVILQCDNRIETISTANKK